ncbi:MAG: DUF1566 domain-containing protein [Gammaproteobacteria bacterium]|nr:DUF1566 domain-containing protein [Gammaproteobacteria bacterium]
MNTRNTLFTIATSLLLPACILVESPPPNAGGSGLPKDQTKLILNDTGVNFYLEHSVASTELGLASPSLTPLGSAPGQDAATGPDSTEIYDADGRLGFSYTKLEGDTGAKLASEATTWSCVQDNVTGLIWEVKTLAGDHAARDMYTWYDPTNTNGGDPGLQAKEGDCGGINFLKGNTYDFIQKINERKLCGFSDWRLPLREEFRSIIDYGAISKPYVDERFFPNMIQRRHRWTAESSYNEPNKAWAFHPDDGRSEVHPKACTSAGGTLTSGFTNGVMLVRGPN